MPYKCQSCGHKMKHVSSEGACPACFSMNVKASRINSVAAQEKPAKTKLEIAIAMLLWSLLLYGLYDHYLKIWFNLG